MVMRKGENWRAEDLRRFVRDNFPKGTIVITRKPTNHISALICGETGSWIAISGTKEKPGSNFELVTQLTDPDGKVRKQIYLPLLDVPRTVNLAAMEEKLATKILHICTELTEITGTTTIKITFKDGFPKLLRTDFMEYSTDGRKKER